MKSRLSRLPLAWLVALLAIVVGGTAHAADSPLELRPIFREDAVISVAYWAAFKPTVKSRLTGREIVPGIDVFADGRCLVRTFEGWEFQKNILDPNKVGRWSRNSMLWGSSPSRTNQSSAALPNETSRPER